MHYQIRRNLIPDHSSQDFSMPSPRKKRDFYGKSTTPTSLNSRSSRHINKADVSLPHKPVLRQHRLVQSFFQQ